MHEIECVARVEISLEVAAQNVGLTSGGEGVVSAVVLEVDKSQRKIFRRPTNKEAVGEEDDARQAKHKKEQENVSLHCDPILDKQGCNVGERW